ncbi:MAG: hypothetical protein KDK12_16925 [Rhodobacteraceae bacterium]|nr:hypothetical protein [Paracoccaceae bacterium]
MTDRPLLRVLLAAALALPAAEPLWAADMRDCRLDALSFIDPWGGERFDVERVGERRQFWCDDHWVPYEQGDRQRCSGPFGELLLSGRFDHGEVAVMVYSVSASAPCCVWDLYSPEEAQQRFPDIPWYPPGEAPLLRSRGFASIESQWGSIPGHNPLIALACAHSLP